MKKKQYIKPAFQVYPINMTEVICTSPDAVRTMLWADQDETPETDEYGVIQAGSSSYRTTLWE